MRKTETRLSTVDREKREQRMREAKASTVTFRLDKQLKEALDVYLLDHPRESQTALIVDLLGKEFRKLGYLQKDKVEPELLDATLDASEIISKATDELDETVENLKRTIQRMRR